MNFNLAWDSELLYEILKIKILSLVPYLNANCDV